MEVQAPTSTTVGYLLMLDAQTTDCKELTSLFQESKCVANLPIKIKTKELRLTRDQKKTDLKNPDRLEVVTILCAGHLIKATVKTCRKNFNSTKSRDLCNCPGGILEFVFTWYVD